MSVRPTPSGNLLRSLIELFLGDAESQLLQSGARLLLASWAHRVASWYAVKGVVATCW